VNTVNTAPYHHGNLRHALIKVGLQLAAENGPDAVVLREAARRVGVSPSAAYRHFSGHEGLLDAVRDEALAILQARMEASVASIPLDGADTQRLIAAGQGYFDFAQDSPSLFQCLARGFPLREGWETDQSPFTIIVRLVQSARAQGVEVDGSDGSPSVVEAAVSLWSSVHGLSVLTTTGALSHLPAEDRHRLLEVVLRAAVKGIGL
jgi:AcrR family transcriptional regulator